MKTKFISGIKIYSNCHTVLKVKSETMVFI